MAGDQSTARLQDLHLQPGHTADGNESVENLMQMIKSQKSAHRTFVVMKGCHPIGIIRSSDMFRILGTLYGVALHYKKRLYEVMYSNILVVDWTTPVEDVSRQAMARSYEDIYDDIVVTRNGEYIGVIPVYELLIFMTEYKVREATQKNPLTGLPGNERIRQILICKKENRTPITVIYTDIDHFKSFNDVYGFKYGDDVLKWVGKVLQEPNTPDLFVGHIGGDDFFTCLLPQHAEVYCQSVIKLFEQGKGQFYSEDDLSRGYIESLDRNHQLSRFPLISLSMAILDVHPNDHLGVSEISSMVALIKKQAKQIQGSNYFRESTR